MRRVEFDATLDEVVDASMRMVQHTAAYRQERRQYQWVVGICCAGGLAVGILRTNDVPSLAALAIAPIAALTSGLTLGALYGRYHDWYVRRRYRRIVSEMYGGADIVHCEFEARDDVFWSRSVHAEVSLPWSRLTRIENLPGSIELWFNPGLAIIRDRAFRTQEERHAFLDAIRAAAGENCNTRLGCKRRLGAVAK
jgi:hypothetical protein